MQNINLRKVIGTILVGIPIVFAVMLFLAIWVIGLYYYTGLTIILFGVILCGHIGARLLKDC